MSTMFVLFLLLQYEVLQDDYQSAISRVDDLGIQLNNEVQRNAVLSVSSPSIPKAHFYFMIMIYGKTVSLFVIWQ